MMAVPRLQIARSDTTGYLACSSASVLWVLPPPLLLLSSLARCLSRLYNPPEQQTLPGATNHNTSHILHQIQPITAHLSDLT